MNWARYITGWSTVEVTGAEPEKLLYALAERGITFWAATPPKNYALTVEVPEKAAKLIPALARAVGCEMTGRSRHGIPALISRIRGRFALIACLSAALLTLLASSAFIWEIEITGNETIPEGVIRQALSECGVDIGAYWPAFSQDQIRNSVILRVPGIRWMTVSVRGSHAKVVVREAREPIETVDRKEYVAIVAEKAGLVEQVLPLWGTALVEANRAVLPGETLIGGYVTGRFGVQGPARAIGAVTARTWYELVAQAPVTVWEKGEDGGKTTRWSLLLGKTRINFYKGSSICPAGCDKIIKKYPLAKEGLFALPVTLEKTVLTEYALHRTEAAELRAELEAQLMEELIAAIGEDGQVVSSDFTASEKDGIMSVTLRAECREQIGTEVPLTEEDIREIQMKIPKTEEQDQ